tara:strand:+ start:71 stop:715 length:645 start_codon:yes stop_codon:yes gene_type:complete
MFNRLLTEADLRDFYEEVDREEYRTKFPHRDLWYNHDDAILKWISILREFKSIGGKNLKVVDLGAGPASLPHIISSLGHDVTAIDIADINHLINQSLVKMVLGDVLCELKEIPDSSIDVFIDSCAVTHFAPSGNSGWKQVAYGVHRALKSGGRFILSSDVDLNATDGEFITPQRIIDIMTENNLKLTSPFVVTNNDLENNNTCPWPVVTLTFEK